MLSICTSENFNLFSTECPEYIVNQNICLQSTEEQKINDNINNNSTTTKQQFKEKLGFELDFDIKCYLW